MGSNLKVKNIVKNIVKLLLPARVYALCRDSLSRLRSLKLGDEYGNAPLTLDQARLHKEEQGAALSTPELKFKYPDNFIGNTRIDLNARPYLSYAHFKREGPFCWIDSDNFEQELVAKNLSAQDSEACRKMHQDGYYTISGAFSSDELDSIYSSYEKAMSVGQVEDKFGDARSLDPHAKVPELRDFLNDKRITRWIELFTGRKCVPFQTLVFRSGSGQPEHSDAIHMMTEPEGYLYASWTAFEDIHPDSGPLVYYPGSHRLPYVMNADCGFDYRDLDESYTLYNTNYVPYIQNLIATKNLKAHYLQAKKGDVLIWHHNLIHGGSIVKNKNLTRKSVVNHYFADGVLCYHELSGNLANFDKK